MKLFSVYLAMFVNAAAWTMIYPSGSFLVMQFGLTGDQSKTGFWVGILGFSMMAGRAIFSPIWGKICDKWGRRPVMIISLISVITTSLLFGISSDYWLAVVVRFLMGALGACRLTGLVLVSEYSNKNPKAIALHVMTQQLGNIGGTAIGGILTGPEWNFWILQDYPVLLPNFVIALIGFISLTLFIIYSTQSLQKKQREQSQGRPYKELLSNKAILVVVFNYFLLSFIVSGFLELLPLWMWAGINQGGFNMNTTQIGAVMAISSGCVLFTQSIVYKIMTDWLKLSLYTSAKILDLLSALLWLLMPLATFLSDNRWVSYVVLVGLTLGWLSMQFILLTFSNVAQNQCVDDVERGKMAGIYITANSVSKALSPLFVGGVFVETANSGLIYPMNFAFTFNFMAVILFVMHVIKSFYHKEFTDPRGKLKLHEPLLK